MKSKFWFSVPILLLFSGNFTNIIASNLPSNEKKFSNIGLEYLKRLPSTDYILAPGDSLKIIISRDYPELDSFVSIDGEGTINIPKLNRVYVSGLTVNELSSLLNAAYRKFVKFPSVEIKINNYRSIRVLVSGEVENPGLQTLQGSFSVFTPPDKPFDVTLENKGDSQVFYFPTVFDAIRASGGITQYSDLSNIQIIRKDNLNNGGGKITTTINFESLLETGDNTQNIRIYDSDIIVIKRTNNENKYFLRKAILSKLNPRFVNVFVAGRVNSPGDTKVSKASVLSDAIEMAGGTKVLKGPLTFIRFNNDGSIDKRKFAYRRNQKRGSYKNPLLKDGDLIVVGESALTSFNQILTEMTEPFVGVFSTYGLIKAVQD